MLPNVISFPKDRLLRCPKLMTLISDQFDIPLELVSNVFYDMLELTMVDPINNPIFNWFIVSEDDEDLDMIWFINDAGTQIGYQLDGDGSITDKIKDTQPLNIWDNDFDTIASLSMSITDALRKRLGDDSIVPILKDIPQPNNNYLFRNPGVLVGHYKLSEEDSEYKPFILEQVSDDVPNIYFTDTEFATAFIKSQIQKFLDITEEVFLGELPTYDNNFLEISSGLAEGTFKLEGWEHYEEFILMYDPEDYYKCEVIIPYIAIDEFIKTELSNHLGIDANTILMDMPMKHNNYHILSHATDNSLNEEIYRVPFRYNNPETNKDYSGIAFISVDEKGEIHIEIEDEN
ncbi:MAG: hypothetical protein R3321_00010 [Nitrososphaeraceae archaeon]|nr:hypothetical protein [Nitrososphaeraceae archaeon]